MQQLLTYTIREEKVFFEYLIIVKELINDERVCNARLYITYLLPPSKRNRYWP